MVYGQIYHSCQPISIQGSTPQVYNIKQNILDPAITIVCSYDPKMTEQELSALAQAPPCPLIG
jgi:hypothetical protein